MDNNTNSNQKLMTLEELRTKLLRINNSFCNYISTFNNNFEESPEPLNNAMKYSKELTDDFTQFYQQFNILTEEALKEEVKQNQNTNSAPKKILIDNLLVKHILNVNKNNLEKLKRKNEETNKTIENHSKELSKIFENPQTK